mgnify:CR=1 FL=1
MLPIRVFHESGRLKPVLAIHRYVVHTAVIKAAGSNVRIYAIEPDGLAFTR